MNSRRTSSIAPIIVRFLLAAALLVLPSCDYFRPDRELKGSVFVVTSGAGAYKLALVKVYFCDESSFREKVLSCASDFSQTDSKNLDNAVVGEKQYVETLNKAIASGVKQKELFSVMGTAASDLFKVGNEIDKAAREMEEVERAKGNPFPIIFNSTRVLPDKLKTVKEYFNKYTPDASERQLVADIEQLVTLSLQACRKTIQEKDAYFAEANKIADELSKASENFKSLQATLNDYPKVAADLCSNQAYSAKIVAETDADGLFQISLPKKGSYIAVAKTQRTIVGDKKEFYWWIVPVPKDADAAKLTLSNDNELFTQEGSKVIDLHSVGIGHEWNTSKDAESKLKGVMEQASIEQRKATDVIANSSR